MRLAISYFYQIRFFKPYMIPLSTALFDPKWYHNNSYNKYSKFVDRNGVINGLRIEMLNPHTDAPEGHKYCKDCPEEDHKLNVNRDCDFLKDYRAKLDQLDFNLVIDYMRAVGMGSQIQLGFTQDPLIVLIVHESPDNPCSERWVLQDYFRDHMYELHELIYPIKSNY